MMGHGVEYSTPLLTSLGTMLCGWFNTTRNGLLLTRGSVVYGRSCGPHTTMNRIPLVVFMPKTFLDWLVLVFNRKQHSPSLAFQCYLAENQWALEAKVFDV